MQRILRRFLLSNSGLFLHMTMQSFHLHRHLLSHRLQRGFHNFDMSVQEHNQSLPQENYFRCKQV